MVSHSSTVLVCFTLRELLTISTTEIGEILLSAFHNIYMCPIVLHTLIFILNFKLGSCENQFLSYWFDSTRNRARDFKHKKHFWAFNTGNYETRAFCVVHRNANC